MRQIASVPLPESSCKGTDLIKHAKSLSVGCMDIPYEHTARPTAVKRGKPRPELQAFNTSATSGSAGRRVVPVDGYCEQKPGDELILIATIEMKGTANPRPTSHRLAA